jgi:hypothetical protein
VSPEYSYVPEFPGRPGESQVIFPKPATSHHVIVSPGAPLSRERLFALLTNPDARAWIPGSTRSLRLMMSENWVFKTHPDHRIPTFLLLLESIGRVSRFYSRCGVWHPSQQWFIVWDGSHCWLCNAVRKLQTLDRASRVRRAFGRFQILGLELQAIVKSGVVLDPQFENFGMELRKLRLYYIDDEVYRWSEGHFDGGHGLEVLEFETAGKSRRP